tara:strand:+ start:15518 stop:15619 length:102 start_codon:yes stop_codon:yes gene_type:complete
MQNPESTHAENVNLGITSGPLAGPLVSGCYIRN